MFPGVLAIEAVLVASVAYLLGRKWGLDATLPATFGSAVGGWLTLLLSVATLSSLAGGEFSAALGQYAIRSFKSTTDRVLMAWYVAFPLLGALLGVLLGAAQKRHGDRAALSSPDGP